ncbi:MAG TPA: hypothetical protein VF474_01950 [Phenylobacterium sp.]
MERAARRHMWTAAFAVFVSGLILWGSAAQAGQLVLKNTSAAPITCTVDGWTLASGWNFDWYIQVPANGAYYVGQNASHVGSDGAPVINWVSCGGLTTRSMTLKPSSPSQTLVLNGQQTRVLNVALYTYLPTLPTDRFEGLANYVVQTYQAANPQILLNATLNSDIDTYNFDGLTTLLGPQGFDVIELDTLYLGYLASSGLINPAKIVGEAPLPAALPGATIDGQLYGIPSWLCMDFIYSGNPALKQQATLAQLLQFFSATPAGQRPLVGDFNGSWRLPSIYINAYVQTYGYGHIAQATTMPPDPGVIASLVSLSDTCNLNGADICTNNTVHNLNNASNGASEQIFATGGASADVGFSEQSFYVNLYGPATPLYVIPTPWGQTPQPLLFQDVFVSSAATCGPSTPCAADATAFTTLMTGMAMKNYITQSQDLPAGSPWRTLLVANAGFWNQPAVQANPVYQQVSGVFATARPFPNTFTAAVQTNMAQSICKSLQASRPAYVCKTGVAASNVVPLPAAKPKPKPAKPASKQRKAA